MLASGQELGAFVIVACAALYLLRRLTGWPRKRTPGANVLVGSRLARGLKNSDRIPPSDRAHADRGGGEKPPL